MPPLFLHAEETTVAVKTIPVAMMVGLKTRHAGNIALTANIRDDTMAACLQHFLNIDIKPRVRCYLCPHWPSPT